MDLALLAAFFGTGCLGAVLSIAVNMLREANQKPRLRCYFASDEPGCTVTIRTSNNEVAKYLRLKVLNVQGRPAEHVSVSLTRVSFTPDGGVTTEFREEVLDLKLAMTGDHSFRLPSGAHRFVDLYRATFIRGEVKFGFDFVRNPLALHELGFAHGRYLAEIFLSADGADSFRYVAEWTWDGTPDGLRITRFRGIG